MDGGPDRDRTGDLLNAIQARSQLRYRPPGKTTIVTRPGLQWQPEAVPMRSWRPQVAGGSAGVPSAGGAVTIDNQPVSAAAASSGVVP